MDSASVSGPVRQLGAVIRPLLDIGFRIHCVVFQRITKPQIESATFLRDMGAEVTVLADKRPFDLSALFQLQRLIATIQPSVIETHGYRPSSILALLKSCRLTRIPWIGYFHGRTAETRLVRLYDKIDHFALRFADLVVVMSEQQRREKRGYRTEVRILHNATITESASEPLSVRVVSQLLQAKRPRVGVIGRLSPEKGVDLLLDAWRLLVERGQNGSLVIAGDGSERSDYESASADLVCAGRVIFLGHLRATKDLYKHLELMVIPSRSEGLPNVFLEALQHGIPVVSTRVGAIPELVGDTNIAKLIPVDDIRAMADAIETELGSRERPEQRASAVNALVSRLSLSNRVAAIQQTFADTLDPVGDRS